MKIKNGAIIIYKAMIGKVIYGTMTKVAGKILFYPAGQGQYWEDRLEEIINAADVRYPSLEEKIVYLKMEMTRNGNNGNLILNVHTINNGEYIIFEVSKPDEERNIFYTHLNFKETCRGYYSLDSAIIGLLEFKYQGNNSQAGFLFERMLQMNDKGNTHPCSAIEEE